MVTALPGFGNLALPVSCKLSLFLIQQEQFHFPALADGGYGLALIVTEPNVIIVDVAVATLYLLNKAAFGAVGVAHERAIAYVVGEGGEKEAVLAVGAEHRTKLAEVAAEQGIGLLAREWQAEVFAGLYAMAIANIGIVLGLVKPLKILDAGYGSFKQRQLINAVTLRWSHGNGEDEGDNGDDRSHSL